MASWTRFLGMLSLFIWIFHFPDRRELEPSSQKSVPGDGAERPTWSQFAPVCHLQHRASVSQVRKLRSKFSLLPSTIWYIVKIHHEKSNSMSFHKISLYSWMRQICEGYWSRDLGTPLLHESSWFSGFLFVVQSEFTFLSWLAILCFLLQRNEVLDFLKFYCFGLSFHDVHCLLFIEICLLLLWNRQYASSYFRPAPFLINILILLQWLFILIFQ